MIFCRIESRHMRDSNMFMFLRRTHEYGNSLVPTTVSWQGVTPNIIHMHGYSSPLPSFMTTTDLNLPVSNDLYIRSSSPNNKLDLIRAASNGRLKAVADASYTPTLNYTIASAAWIMETEDKKFSWEGSGLIFSRYNSSYGGEIYGVYLILRFLHIMWPQELIWSGLIQIKCDNLTGINDCSYLELKISKSKKFRALLRAIRKI